MRTIPPSWYLPLLLVAAVSTSCVSSAELGKLQAESREQTQRIAELTEANEALRSTLSHLEKEKDYVSSQLLESREHLGTARGEANILRKELEEAESSLRRSIRNLDEVTERLEQCRDEVLTWELSDKGQIVDRCELEKRLSFEQGAREVKDDTEVSVRFTSEPGGLLGLGATEFCSLTLKYRGKVAQRVRIDTGQRSVLSLGSLIDIAGGLIKLKPTRAAYHYKPARAVTDDSPPMEGDVMFAVYEKQ